MGQRIFKPSNIFSRPIIFRGNIDNCPEIIQNHTELVSTIDEISQSILQIVNEIYDTYFENEDNLSKDLLEINLYPRAGRKRPLDKVDSEEGSKVQKCESDIKFFTDVYSFDELVKFLNEGVNNDDNLQLDNIEEKRENIEQCLIDVAFKGNDEEVNKLTKNDLEILFQKKILLKLSEDKKFAPRLKLLLNNSARHGIITKYIDDVDNNNNPAISIALLNSNLEIFCYLLKRAADIPTFIYLQNQKIPFLNYIAMNGKIQNEKLNGYILSEILKTIIRYYGKDKMESCLCQIDCSSGLSLPHLLLIQYQTSPDMEPHLTSCLKLCIDNCPESLKVMCTSIYCNSYKFNVIAHSIILPVTNFEIIKAFMKLDNTEDELRIYKSLVMVHQDLTKREKLLMIIK